MHKVSDLVVLRAITDAMAQSLPTPQYSDSERIDHCASTVQAMRYNCWSNLVCECVRVWPARNDNTICTCTKPQRNGSHPSPCTHSLVVHVEMITSALVTSWSSWTQQILVRFAGACWVWWTRSYERWEDEKNDSSTLCVGHSHFPLVFWIKTSDFYPHLESGLGSGFRSSDFKGRLWCVCRWRVEGGGSCAECNLITMRFFFRNFSNYYDGLLWRFSKIWILRVINFD